VTEKRVGLLAGFAVAAILAGIAGTVAFYKVPAFHALLHPHADNAAEGGAAKPGKMQYTCPMHPFIVSDKPGACPICGMTLVPKESMAANLPDNAVQSLGMVSMNPTQRLMANVATQKVARREFGLDTLAVGKVTWDERKVARVSSRVGGRVEKLHVDFTGTRVVSGQPLLEIYSPDLVATQREYLVALKGVERLKDSPYEDAREMSRSLVEASRMRLKLWGVTDEQLGELAATKEPKTVFTVFAPRTGVVTERLVSAGQYVMEGAALYSIAEMDPVWVQAEVHEFEIRRVPVGTSAVVTTQAYPGREFHGKVAFLDPYMNVETRTLKVRVDLPNPAGILKPEMFVRVAFRGRKGTVLAVPESAVLVTGERAMSWVEVEPNTFEPRVIRVGGRANGYYEILSGLSEGETVVTSAGFLIDSESQLKGGQSDPHAGHGAPEPGKGATLPPKDGAAPAAPAPDHSGHGK
jgi:Cu(I)/Ag(I) efflux system membrane fusion protein